MFPIIAARATAIGAGAVSLIRISGAQCHTACASFFSIEKIQIRHAHYCYFVDPHSKQKIDDVIAVFFAASKSYTGEESIEFTCHGGIFVSEKILTILFSNGITSANPGEFTRRAVLNGRMDLTQAEGVKALVEAVSEQEWECGRALLDGSLKDKIALLRSKIIAAMAILEARIDFPDEGDVAGVGLDKVNFRVLDVQNELRSLRETYTDGKVAYDGLRVAIIGAPNSGKSTLLNYLLKKNRAIVSEVAGTTRDYIEEKCLVKGRLIRLFDTAGLRETEEVIEKMGIALSYEIAGEADLILELHEGEDVINFAKNKNILRVRTKIDIHKELRDDFDLGISCKTGENCDVLLDRIVEICDSHLKNIKGTVFLANERQFSAINNALNYLEKYWQLIQSKSDELLAFELQESIRSLESLIGAVTNDNILDKIFSEFCVGK